ncbi:MAG: HEPN domain-containing protein [Armatimonadetes bacterium]|nr:HEPN domain-containing protein [Armatimonadota bacterium]
MTGENRRANLNREWKLSQESFCDGETLLASGSYRGAMTHFYYACLQAARAALLSEGVEPRTHSGVRSEFARLFVRPGSIPRSAARALAYLEKRREDAHYDREADFQEEDALEARD